jgi:serine/threonine protein kinase
MADESAESSEGEFAPGLVLSDKFRIIRLIARGGMGSVYEAEQLVLQRRVAIKTLRAELAEDQQLRQRFVREGRVAARVRHPHIVEVIDTGEHETTPYLVMELLDGNDLAAHVRARGRVSLVDALDLLLPVCAAIASAHDGGVIHRDIKPENVALVRVGRGATVAKLVDFGLSKNTTSATARAINITEARAVIGTPLYMPPEAVLGPSHIDARSDQYSFAVVLYECVTGRTPFVADTLAELVRVVSRGNPPRPSAIAPNVDPAFDAVVLRAMSVERAKRYSNLWDLGAALLPFASERTRGSWAEAFATGSRRSVALASIPIESGLGADRALSARRWPAVLGAVAAAAVCAIALRWTLAGPPPSVQPERTTPPGPASGGLPAAIDAGASEAAASDAATNAMGPDADGQAPQPDATTGNRPAPRDAGARRRPRGSYEIF